MNRGRLYSPDGLGGTGGGTEPGEQPKNSGDSKPMNRAQMMLAKKNDNGGRRYEILSRSSVALITNAHGAGHPM